MDTILWIIWAIAGGAYVGVLLLSTRCERRFMEDPDRWASNSGSIVVLTTRPASRAAATGLVAADAPRVAPVAQGALR